MENRELFEEMVAWLKGHHSAEELRPSPCFAGSPIMWYYEVARYDNNLPKKFMKLIIDATPKRSEQTSDSDYYEEEYIEIEVPGSGLFGNPVEYKRVKREAYEALFQNNVEMGDS